MYTSFFHHSLSPCARLKPANVNVIYFLHLNTCSAGFRLLSYQNMYSLFPQKLDKPSGIFFFFFFCPSASDACAIAS